MFAKVHDSGIDGRIFRSMVGATTLAVILSVPFTSWRVTTGLFLGGVLSLFKTRNLEFSQ